MILLFNSKIFLFNSRIICFNSKIIAFNSQPDVEEGNEMVFCDGCDVGVHQVMV